MGRFNDLQAPAAAPKGAGGTYRKIDQSGRGKRGVADEVSGVLETLYGSVPFLNDIRDNVGAYVKTGVDLAQGKTSFKRPTTWGEAVERVPDAFRAVANDYAANRRAGVDRKRMVRDDFSARRPLASAGTEGVGIALQAVPTLMTGGAALAPGLTRAGAPAAESGLAGALQKATEVFKRTPVVGRLPLRAMVEGGAVSGLSGAVSALGGEGTLDERAEDMNEAVLPSVALGAGMPLGLMGLVGLVNAGKQALRPAVEKNMARAGRVLADRAPGAAVLGPAAADDLRMPFERMGPGGETVARAVAAVPGPGQDIARSTLTARRQGARGRIVASLRRELGDDGSSFHTLKDALDKRRLVESEPLYREAFDRAPPVNNNLERLKARPSIRKAMRRGADLAHEAGENPNALGLFDMEDMADWATDMPPARGAEIERAMGRRAPSRPPSRGKSLNKFIADGGGIRDRGDVQAMGGAEWNKGRAYQRSLLGDGADADEWALRAWEAGYFPQFQSRPTANDLLDAIGDEIRGRPRFAREADPRVTDRMRQLDEAEEMNYRGGPADDLPDPEGYGGRPEPRTGPVEGEALSWKAWDYVKRGLDDELEALRDPVTRKLPRTDEVRLIEQTRKELRRHLTDLNPKYREALAAYTGPSRQMNSMDMGRRMVTGKADPEEIAEGMELMGRDEQDAMRLGVARGLSDVFRSRDPQRAFRQFLDDDVLQERLRLGFGDDATYARFMKDIGEEFEANLSYNRVLTGSRTTPLAEDIASVNRAAEGDDPILAGLRAAQDGRPLRTRAFDWAATKLRQAREASSGLNNPEVSRLLGQALFRAGNIEDLMEAMVRARVISPEEVKAVLPALTQDVGQGAGVRASGPPPVY